MFTLLRLIFLPAKVGVGTTKLGVRAGYRTGRMLGYRRMFVFAAGIGVGLLVAPMTGQQARDKLRRSEEHTSELQSLMRISYAVFCLKKTHYQFRCLTP